MNPSDNNSFGMPNAAGGQGMMAQPVAPRDTGDILLPGSEKKGGKKWIYALLGVVVVVILVAVGAWMITKGDEGDDGDSLNVLEMLSWVSYTKQCDLVIEDVDNPYRSIDDYDAQIAECRDVTAALKDQMSNLGGSATDKRLKSEIESYVVFGDELEKDLSVYRAWHEWLINTNYLSYYQTDADIDEMVKPLLESGNDTLVKYGEEWATARKALVEAYLFDKTNYHQEQAIFDDVVKEAPDIHILTSIGVEKDSSELVQAMLNAAGGSK